MEWMNGQPKSPARGIAGWDAMGVGWNQTASGGEGVIGLGRTFQQAF